MYVGGWFSIWIRNTGYYHNRATVMHRSKILRMVSWYLEKFFIMCRVIRIDLHVFILHTHTHIHAHAINYILCNAIKNIINYSETYKAIHSQFHNPHIREYWIEFMFETKKHFLVLVEIFENVVNSLLIKYEIIADVYWSINPGLHIPWPI